MVLLCAIWGMQQVAIKLALAGISPLLQVGLRSVVAAVLVFGWARARDISLFPADGTMRPGLLAGLLFALEFICIYAGLEYTNASRMIVFLYTAPCFTVLGLHWFVAGERIGVRHGFGVALAFAGIVLAFAEGMWRPATADFSATWIGDLLGVLAAILWAATTVVIRATGLARISATRVLLYQLVVSAAIVLPLSFLMGEPGITAPTPTVLLAMAYQAVIVAFASYLAWFWLLTKFLASRLMVFSFLTPLFGVLFGVVLLGERLSAQFGLAALLVVAGIVLVNAPGRRT
ncbi:MAG: DMT family transporter [Gammaproteobacteria bacterium]|nr:DMT family transporter [Gammaproteobacteria bacterium]MBU1414038.1 DMT family transporter [Gammaproteobacteria bacterium]